MRTFTPKPADINRAWHVIDAEGQVLGRSPPRSPPCCGASTSRSGRPTSTPATTSSWSTPPSSTSAPASSPTSSTTATRATRAVSRSESLEHLLAPRPRAGRAPRGQGHAPEEPARPQHDPQAADLRRPDHPHAASSPSRSQLDRRSGASSVPKPLIQSTGRRKEAVARVRLRPGTGVSHGQRPRRSSSTSRSSRTASSRSSRCASRRPPTSTTSTPRSTAVA